MSLRIKAAAGARSLSLSAAASVIIGFAQTIVLSRLLQPRDFGLSAMIWAVLGFAGFLADMGVSNAIVYRQDTSSDALSSLYWVNIAAGFVVAVAVLLSGPLLVGFYHEPILKQLVPWVALSFLITASGQQFSKLAQRDLHFNRIATSDVVFASVGFLVSGAYAYLGYGVFSLVYAAVAAPFARSVFLMQRSWSEWRPRLHFARRDLKGFLRFGFLQMGERGANYWWSNIDYVIVGRYLGSSSLGIYRLAYETVVRPLGIVNPIMNTVAFPIFAKKQNDDEGLRRGFLEVMRLLGTMVWPILAGLAVVAPYAVPVIFGPKWVPAIPIIQILCILGILRAMANPAGNILLAKGKVESSFRWNVYQAIISTLVFWLVVRRGIVALSWSAVAVMAASILLSWNSYYRQTINLSPVSYLKNLVKPITFSTLMMPGVYGVLRVVQRSGLHNNYLLLTLGVGAGVLIYFALILGLDGEYARSVLRLFTLRTAKSFPERRDTGFRRVGE